MWRIHSCSRERLSVPDETRVCARWSPWRTRRSFAVVERHLTSSLRTSRSSSLGTSGTAKALCDMSKTVVMASKLARMRIIAIPLTSDPSRATYYHFQTPKPSDTAKPSLLKKVTGKVADLWAGFGRSPEGSWKVLFT